MRFMFFSIAMLLVVVEPSLDIRPLFADESVEPAPSAPGPGRAASAPQKATHYEEDSANPNGVQHDGAAVWRTVQAPSPTGQAPEVTIQAGIEIPARGMSVRVSLRRNNDPQLPASHIIDVTLTLAPDFSHGGIQKIPGILLQPAETARGAPLNGVAVKVTNDHFMVGLSSRDADVPTGLHRAVSGQIVMMLT